MSLGQVFISELLGTAILVVLGVGVVANVLLPRNGGFGGGPLMINIGSVSYTHLTLPTKA